MCGCFTIDTDYEKIKEQFGIHQIEPLLNSFNVAPTGNALGIVSWYVKEKKTHF
ncbi:hypothetical protein [Legionella cardiaca]|uniref:Uncharacterized protein n=1 Tax=Legionella cardiaca TaxID=1071983 RepID=A0ABY8AW73_9GAMM|nr:hypothetical protein [Legionella cardiaca]WED43989.1 hypothetical protein PXX05_04175 [Legionella cardiaca]